jgi:N-acetylglucosaminyldiphosphoundecaprenol N-acetyl-beta-D-mannosaminyltransferase
MNLEKTSDQIKAVNILGVHISAIDMARAVNTIEHFVADQIKTYVCVTGVHGVIESQRDPDLRRIHNNAGLVTPDGMPLVYLGRLWSNREMDRVYGPDLMLEVCKSGVPRGVRHFFYGATDTTLRQLRGNLIKRLPNLQVVGTFSPPFRELTSDEAKEIASLINDHDPDIVWVGLSTPKQERWMSSFREALKAPVLVGVGAAFDFHAGNVRQAPPVLQRLCLEWLFRLSMEPRRLWRRYLYNNPLFLMMIVTQMLGRRFDTR